MLLRIVLGVIALIWILGMVWGWRFHDNQPFWWRALLAVLWPLTWVALKCAVIPALAMTVLLGALFAAAIPGPAHADSMFRQGADWVRLQAKACVDAGVIAAITAQGYDPARFFAASASVAGHDFVACWTPLRDGAGLIYSDGDRGYVPAEELKPVIDL